MGILKEVAKLTRIEHAVMLAVAVLIAESIVLGGLPEFSLVILLSLAVPVFSEVAAFSLNDYMDIDADRANKRTGRPLVAGTLSPSFALWLAVVGFLVSTAAAFLINIYAFVVVVLFNLLAVAYNVSLKVKPVVGNFYIATTMAVPFIFGNVVLAPELHPLNLTLAGLAFISGFAREILKSVEDIKGDVAARGAKTLPVIIGKRRATLVAVALYAVFIPLTFLPFVLMEIGIVSVLLVAAADTMMVHVCLGLLGESQDYRQARKLSLAALAVGLAGFMLAVL